MIDIDKARKDTPGCHHAIHLNNAGASLMPAPVIDAMRDYMDFEAITGGYESAALRSSEIEDFYPQCANLLGSRPKNIAYTANATDSYARALSSITFQKDDVVLTSTNDYISNQMALLSMQKRIGIRLMRAADLPEGGVDPESVEELIVRHRPKLVSISHIPTNSGLIQDVRAVGEVCRKYNTTYLIDACQSAGQLPLDVNNLHCDFLSATFRKFLRGPRGAGFLYVSDRVLSLGLEPLFIDMRGGQWLDRDNYAIRDDARRFEDWETNYALLMGARSALKYARQIGVEHIHSRLQQLSSQLRLGLSAIDNVEVLDKGSRQCGIVTCYISDTDPTLLMQKLQEHRINAGVSLREYAVIDFDEKSVPWALRLSPHYYNTGQELDQALEVIREIADVRL